jgi:hypothetical protein
MKIENDIVIQKIGYGLKNGQIVHIDKVDRGLECDSFCPSCGGQLVAKKGDVNIHHFAHYDGEGNQCGESVLHKVSKEIVFNQKRLLVPSKDVELKGVDIIGGIVAVSHSHKGREYLFDRIWMEQSELDFIPDITAESLGEKIFIEIKVSHAVPEEKITKVRQLGIPMIEIDMSSYSSMDSLNKLTAAVIADAPRHWVYHPKHEEIRSYLKPELESKLNERECELRNNLIGIDGCRSDFLRFLISETESANTVVVLGYKSVTGYSRKNSSNFSFSELKIAEQVCTIGSNNYNIKGAGGIEENTIAIDESVLRDIETIQFPCIAKLTLDSISSRGRRLPLVTGLKVV